MAALSQARAELTEKRSEPGITRQAPAVKGVPRTQNIPKPNNFCSYTLTSEDVSAVAKSLGCPALTVYQVLKSPAEAIASDLEQVSRSISELEPPSACLSKTQ
jgi:hypothetical protein